MLIGIIHKGLNGGKSAVRAFFVQKMFRNRLSVSNVELISEVYIK